MNARKIREELGRARTCAQRNDYPRALYLFCMALKELGGQTAPTDLRGDIRTAIADLCADPAYKQECSQPVGYQPGKERELLAFFNRLYKKIMGREDVEDYETTLKRKLALDRCINDGKVFLSQGKPSEADECFARALTYYKNEIAAFGMMAKAMMEAGHFGRALGYARKGLAEKPDNQDLRRIAEECAKKRAR